MALDDLGVGQRVVVRRLLPGRTGPTGRPAMSDVLGILEATDADRISVRRADGELVVIPRAEVVLAKPVPPAPPRRRG